MTYENAYDTGGDGVFRFIDPEDQAEYIYTNFEPYEAHRMAPLFDQPDIKGKLSLIVAAPAAWRVFGNGAETATSSEGMAAPCTPLPKRHHSRAISLASPPDHLLDGDSRCQFLVEQHQCKLDFGRVAH